MITVASSVQTNILYRPIGPIELDLIKQSGYKKFPPRLPEQPIFYPVCNREYAEKIAIYWNFPIDKVAIVVAFHVNADYLSKHQKQLAGGRECEEYWIPAEELEEFNSNIVGLIEVITELF